MTRLCERPGCSDRAEIAYGFDATTRIVWLDTSIAPTQARSGALCRRHADAMAVPLGWTLDDRREPVPRLFRCDTPTSVAPRPATAPSVKRRAERAPVGEQLRLDTGERPVGDEPDGDAHAEQAEPHEPPTTEPDQVAPWVPHFDQRDDLHGLLDANGPLLSRAFGGRSRPEG